jgi:site-specific DNA-methyltransferase (adenine-specific)
MQTSIPPVTEDPCPDTPHADLCDFARWKSDHSPRYEVDAPSSADSAAVPYELMTGSAWTLVHQQPRPIVQAIVTSPPYWKQRRYTASSEEFGRGTLEAFVTQLANLFEALTPWLTPNGTAWLNIGDSYVDHELQFVPQKAVLAIQQRGWRIVSEVIYEKRNATPRPSPGRPARFHEHVFLLTPHRAHYYNDALMTEPAKYAGYVMHRKPQHADGRIRLTTDHVVPARRTLRSVWTGPTGWHGLKHPALMPRTMTERYVLSISAPGDLVLDPFSALGSTGAIALAHHRRYLGWELNPGYVADTRRRLDAVVPIEPYTNALPAVTEAPEIEVVDGIVRRRGWKHKQDRSRRAAPSQWRDDAVA